MEKELEIKITGNAKGFAGAAQEAMRTLNEVKHAAKEIPEEVAKAMIGGLAQGSVVVYLVDKIKELVFSLKEMLEKAHKLEISRKDLSAAYANSFDTGTERSVMDQAMFAAKQSRADAAAGSSGAAKAYSALGLSPEAMEGKKADEILYAILAGFHRSKQDDVARFALRQLIGGGPAEELEPWAGGGHDFGKTAANMKGMGGAAMLMGMLLRGVNPIVQAGTALLPDSVSGNREKLMGKKDFEPLSMASIERQQQAAMREEQNRQTALQLTRQQLPHEQQITAAIAERARLEKLIADTKDPVKRQRLISDALQVESELIGLQKPTGGATAGSSAPHDPLRSIGADYSRFGVAMQADYAKQTVSEIKRLRDAMTDATRRINAALTSPN